MRTVINHKALIPITEKLMRVRQWEKDHLPIEQSPLALDLFLLISYNTLIGNPLTLKILFHSTDYSEAGIRKHLRRLLAEEWCFLIGNESDRRLRYVVAQPKMLQVLNDYAKVLTVTYKKSSPRSIYKNEYQP